MERKKDIGKGVAQIPKDKYFSFYFKVEFLKRKETAYCNSELDYKCVKGRLKKRWRFWEQLGANKFIIDLIKSANDNKAFVSETLNELIRVGSVIEVPFQPALVDPCLWILDLLARKD